MKDEINEKYSKEIKKLILLNSIKYNSISNPKVILGKLINIYPEIKKNIRCVQNEIDNIIMNIKNNNRDIWIKELEELDPILLNSLHEKKEPEKGLKELPKSDKVIMRFAPNPNGPPTIGSSRGMIINTEYVKRYNGKFILRYDDTDPDQKVPMKEAYEWYLDDFKWLGVIPDKIIYASERLDIYYEIAKELIQLQKAYVCFCKMEKFRELKNNKIECEHRNQSIEDNLKYWENMLGGKYNEHEAVLRIKTDINHKDPALRDWGAFRILKKKHPHLEEIQCNKDYIVWPLLDFEGAIEDHLLDTTHIIRGKDLQDSGKRQKYIYDYLNWEYPITLHWGRVKIEEFGKLSTSKIKKLISDGIYHGWDDPKLPTIRSIRRRGIQPEALKKVMINLGVGETDISISMESIYAENRKLIDPIANRYFFVWDPELIEVINLPINTKIKIPIHPNKRNEYRYINIKENKLYISHSDVLSFSINQEIRLKDLCNIKIISINPLKAIYINEPFEGSKFKSIKIIQWVEIKDAKNIIIITPDKEISGYCESNVRNEYDKVIQFERFGFCRIDKINDREIIAYYSHK